MVLVGTSRKGFSLVELSIVLVILGLLTGGILAGQSLIRAAELRAVTTEFQRYTTASYSFRDKYFAMPGDWNNAQAVWGAQGTNCSGTVTTLATTGTCNGDGDGNIGYPGASMSAEAFQFWRQLALAGLIEGSYTGVAGSGSAIDSQPGTNIPRSKMNGAGWGVQYIGGSYGDTETYTAVYGNALIFGGTVSGSLPRGSILKPEEAWNIDTKMDDGKPGTGKILAFEIANFANANACTTSASTTDYAGTYALSRTSLACSFYFPQAIR